MACGGDGGGGDMVLLWEWTAKLVQDINIT